MEDTTTALKLFFLRLTGVGSDHMFMYIITTLLLPDMIGSIRKFYGNERLLASQSPFPEMLDMYSAVEGR